MRNWQRDTYPNSVLDKMSYSNYQSTRICACITDVIYEYSPLKLYARAQLLGQLARHEYAMTTDVAFGLDLTDLDLMNSSGAKA